MEELFNIGDEVETTEEYRNAITELQDIFEKPAKTYFSGRITRFQLVTGEAAGDRPWVCVTLDNDIDKMVNQDFLKKV
jgi:hypothetical protein